MSSDEIKFRHTTKIMCNLSGHGAMQGAATTTPNGLAENKRSMPIEVMPQHSLKSRRRWITYFSAGPYCSAAYKVFFPSQTQPGQSPAHRCHADPHVGAFCQVGLIFTSLSEWQLERPTCRLADLGILVFVIG
jgi:hypothetical protein